jgi:hypothetical protein
MKSQLCRILLLLAASFVVASTAAAAMDPATARKELTALYHQYGRLLRQEHRYPLKQFFLKHTTEDFVLKQDGKTYSREDAAELLDEGPMAMISFTGYDLKITSLQVKGNQVVVVFNDRTAGMMPDPRDDERVHKMVMTSTTRETWVKTPEGWMTRMSEVLSSRTLLNGKPVRPQAPRKR